jgi:hypothetical protein
MAKWLVNIGSIRIHKQLVYCKQIRHKMCRLQRVAICITRQHLPNTLLGYNIGLTMAILCGAALHIAQPKTHTQTAQPLNQFMTHNTYSVAFAYKAGWLITGPTA